MGRPGAPGVSDCLTLRGSVTETRHEDKLYLFGE